MEAGTWEACIATMACAVTVLWINRRLQLTRLSSLPSPTVLYLHIKIRMMPVFEETKLLGRECISPGKEGFGWASFPCEISRAVWCNVGPWLSQQRN